MVIIKTNNVKQYNIYGRPWTTISSMNYFSGILLFRFKDYADASNYIKSNETKPAKFKLDSMHVTSVDIQDICFKYYCSVCGVQNGLFYNVVVHPHQLHQEHG